VAPCAAISQRIASEPQRWRYPPRKGDIFPCRRNGSCASLDGAPNLPEGHTIGTHSEDHPPRFGKLSPELVEWEIDKGILDVEVALGDHRHVTPFFRVPGLARSEVIESELEAWVLVLGPPLWQSELLRPSVRAPETYYNQLCPGPSQAAGGGVLSPRSFSSKHGGVGWHS
jgi:peptidoglycan/xylan/chitin deacetylase (PgdA/CDA1 family)